MLNVVLFGPPGSGKGTQSIKLIEKYGIIHLSTGDIFRANIKGGTDLGNLAKSYMDKGDLVPDEVTTDLLISEVNKHVAPKGFIFDGYPRTTSQAQALDAFLATKGWSISGMIALEVDNDELKKRLLLRGKDSGRVDDQNPEIIANRINEYNNKTAPLKSYYEAQGKYRGVEGVGEVDQIFSSLCKEIDSLK